jgi:2-succinyl-5-enolpyruvyl-6-hydroxy-3-cyclohexene-1-carboxylate synthase
MKLNLEKIFFCTGARNHDLLKVFPAARVAFDYDERAAAFKALGLAKVAGAPVAVCTTSGTAVAECVPAMLEAFYSELPLVLITGDRPKKLHGTGSPQTIEHEALTRSCRGSYVEVDLRDLPALTLADAKFPVHVNVLVDDTVPHDRPLTFHRDLAALPAFFARVTAPLFLFSHERGSMAPFVRRFSETGLPFYAETLSGARELSNLKTERRLVELFQAGAFDGVVRVGHTPLSKIWRLLEKKPLPVLSFDSRNLPALSYGDVVPLGSGDLLAAPAFWDALAALSPIAVNDETGPQLAELVARYPRSEVATFTRLQERLAEGDAVYLGNSLVVRFFELTQKKRLAVFGNRGVNGIDGQLASAIGVAGGISGRLTCILGDVTTFYDLSSLRDLPPNLNLVIVNNKGGRIFDLLNLDKRIVLEHDDDFREIARGLELSYSNDLADFGRVQVLELFPDVDEGARFLEEWNR